MIRSTGLDGSAREAAYPIVVEEDATAVDVFLRFMERTPRRDIWLAHVRIDTSRTTAIEGLSITGDSVPGLRLLNDTPFPVLPALDHASYPTTVQIPTTTGWTTFDGWLGAAACGPDAPGVLAPHSSYMIHPALWRAGTGGRSRAIVSASVARSMGSNIDWPERGAPPEAMRTDVVELVSPVFER